MTQPADLADAPIRRWPLTLIAAPAAVAVWSGWVGLGGMCGFGVVHPLPGIVGGLTINTAITLPVGVEAYGAYALAAWMHPGTPEVARTFARRSAIGALALGMTGQVIYHLLAAGHAVTAPAPVVVLVSCLPVLVLGFGAALTHLIRTGTADKRTPDSGQVGAAPTPVLAPTPAAHEDTPTGQADMPRVGTPDSAHADTAPTQEVPTGQRTADTEDTPRVGAADMPRVGAAVTSGNNPAQDGVAERTREFVAAHPDMSQVAVAKELGISPRTVRRHLSTLGVVPTAQEDTEDSGQADTGQGTADMPILGAVEDSGQDDGEERVS